MSIRLNLPSINGEVELGITVGVDASLPSEKKLPILRTAQGYSAHNVIKANAVAWAHGQFREETSKLLFVNGIAAILDLGLVCDITGAPDGDWIATAVACGKTREEGEDMARLVTIEEMKKAATVALATKANFWLMNHHTGQGEVAGYVKKVLDVMYENQVSNELVSAAHSIGHFTSTIRVLHIAGIQGLYTEELMPVTSANDTTITLSADAQLRFTALPAGTHRLGAAYESAKRLVRSIYAPYCPGLEEFANIPTIRKTVMENPAKYHIGASYLTRQRRAEYQDTDMENYLGRLGTFILTLYKNSTIAKSPHLQQSRVESYPDYDAEFKALLIRIQQIQATSRGRIIEAQLERVEVRAEEVVSAVKAAFK